MINIGCITADLGSYETSIRETLYSLDQQNLSARLWNKDPSLWKEDPEIQKKIKNRLGWLTIPGVMAKELEEITAFAARVKTSGFTDVVLLGMGGSSLCPEVLQKTFGASAGALKLTILDTTDPETLLKTERGIDLNKTLFIVASKSGSTIEVKSLYRYFAEKVRKSISGENGSPFGDHFIAITDPGSPLAHLAEEQQFRKIFLAPSDIGGRYSALTYFGLVPAALIGIDLHAFFGRVEEMVQKTAVSISAQENPAILLGVILGELGKAGRDKVTLIAPEAISSIGIWVEQLVAESTGKEGKGLIPIDGEMLADPGLYGNDRLFVYFHLASDPDALMDQKVAAFGKAGHPVIHVRLRDRLDLAGEFFRWEMATAVAGLILGVNPFDEPNVTESKENTAKVLARFEETRQLNLPTTGTEEERLCLLLNSRGEISESQATILRVFFARCEANQYLALMAYFSASNKHEALLQDLRNKIREKVHIVTTLGYGPRFLHSTGQLHKGGPRKGLFIQITAEDQEEVAIPEAAYGFSVLKRSQALGDFHALIRHQRPLLEIRLGKEVERGLQKLIDLIPRLGNAD